MTRKEMAYMIAGILAIGIFLGVALSCLVAVRAAEAEEEPMMYSCWAMCQPGSEVLIRERPGKRAAVVGAVQSGDRMRTDQREKDGWLHVTGLASESGEGWIFEGYVVFTEPRETGAKMRIIGGGRVACRRWIGGKRKAWIRPGQEVTVYRMTGEWAVTNRGFIQSRYLEGVEE